ncbi:MAG TPA: ribosome maturation factor RimP [Gammaproteobacteria bacterium]|nr:ribosome maturation factor RimP [Gammaproteobacteria bacterium]
MHQDPLNLAGLIEPAVNALGYELVGVEYKPNQLLRVYIDREQGITLDDCEAVSHQVSGLLDVEDPIPGHYQLEVSSPGLDRPLFKARDYERFVGHRVRVRLAAPLQGRRKFKGLLRGLRQEQVIIEEDGQEVCVPLESIEQARLVPDV